MKWNGVTYAGHSFRFLENSCTYQSYDTNWIVNVVRYKSNSRCSRIDGSALPDMSWKSKGSSNGRIKIPSREHFSKSLRIFWVKIAWWVEMGINRFSWHDVEKWERGKGAWRRGKVDKTKARVAKSPAFYYSGGISDVSDGDDDDGGVDDSNADEDRSYSISAVHFMPRIVTHAREGTRGGINIPRTLYELRNINIFLLPMTCRRYDARSVFPPRASLTLVFRVYPPVKL